ncbi:hypothetical protein CVT26_003885 [Gymnopilus dilepis]|uniref:Major facilitator superfamily (MFS) profile domain-containing protein n=1 Tax=Gymnopilus dilepis TaxID=231916 RepID=A0A409W6X9_9AGAR|nr:hypothetical protein CVT26_003885 [Gymnopilus dilepis]
MPGGPVATGGYAIGASGAKSKFAGIAMTSFSAFGGILFGYDTGIISGIKEMNAWLMQFGHPTNDPNVYAITSSQESLVVSILSAGTFFGALFGAPVADVLGRKYGIIFSTLVFCIGIAMQTAATEMPLFVVGRVFAGLGVGLISTLIPMYQSECAPKWIRGAVVASYQWAITIGILVASIVNNAFQNRPDSTAYRIPIALQFAWAVVLGAGMLFLPESPRWLIKRGRDADAALALARLTGTSSTSAEVGIEIDEIRLSLEEEKAIGESSYMDCFKFNESKMALRTLTGISIQAWQQLTGINFIFYYGTTFFRNSGITNAFVISIVTSTVNMVMTIPGMWGVDRFGRRRLLIVGAIGMCICEYIVAVIGATISVDNIAGQRVLIAFVCFYIAFFASTWGPVTWVVCGEIFPLQVRAKAMSMSAASNWLWNFGIGYAIPYLVNTEPGSAGLESRVFFIWGSTCFCCILFTFFCVPETKNLSLEQIDLMYKHTTPIKSMEYRRRLMRDGTNLTLATLHRDFKHEMDSFS